MGGRTKARRVESEVDRERGKEKHFMTLEL